MSTDVPESLSRHLHHRLRFPGDLVRRAELHRPPAGRLRLRLPGRRGGPAHLRRLVSAQSEKHHRMTRPIRSFFVLSFLLLAPSGARACAVCMGADEGTGAAINGAIFLMLGCIFSMLALISAVAISIWRRSHLAPVPPDDLNDLLLDKP